MNLSSVPSNSKMMSAILVKNLFSTWAISIGAIPSHSDVNPTRSQNMTESSRSCARNGALMPVPPCVRMRLTTPGE